MRVGKRVLYSGHVQGVGFRFTTRELAQRFAVGGWVRNLPDGQVELVVEGEAAEVNEFLESLGRTMAGYIQSRREVDEPPSGQTTFEIRR
ncbi:MAG: acylphosphatase [Gemmataceae bacterium]|nr:acylphosphatase [Gemmataceae bacterium]